MSSARQVSLHISELPVTYSGKGFDYEFNAIQDESNELFCAYKEMFEVAISQGGIGRILMNIYLPWLSRTFVSSSS